MTLSAQTPRAIYAGSGTTGPFAVEDADGTAIYFTANAQILVSQFAASGTETELVEGSDYTLTGGPDAGSVTLSTALATGETLVIWRNTTLSQETNFAVNDPYRSSVHGAALDRVVRMLQEINDRGLRAIRLPRTAAASAVSEIPVGSENGILGVGDDGSIVVLDPSEVDGLTGALGVRPITQGGTGATTAEEAITNLGIDEIIAQRSSFGLNVGDVKLSLASSPDDGFVRLTDAVQNLLKADYPDLNAWASAQSYPWGSASTTFGIPAAGGYFLRFGASGSSIDAGGPRTPGTAQAQSLKSHTHTGTTASDGAHTHTIAFQSTAANPGAGSSVPINSGTAITTSSNGAHTHTITTDSTGDGAENRPINVTMYADMLASPGAVAYGLVGAGGFAFKYTTGTAGDPGTGKFGFDTGTISSATSIRISKTASNGASMGDVLATLGIGVGLWITKTGAPSNHFSAVLTSTPTDNSTYLTFSITSATSGGTIANNGQCSISPTIANVAAQVSTDAASAASSAASASSSAASAASALSSAQAWATNPFNTPVQGASYSALHHATEAATSASSAAASAVTALAAANASGAVHVYATKSAANTALSGLSNGDIVEVVVDESRNNTRTRYQKTAGVYVYLMTFPQELTVYVDADSGNDSNSGLTSSAPKLTLSAAISAAAATGGAGNLLLARGAMWSAEYPDFSSLSYWKIGAYGQGNRPVIDGSKVVSGTWTQHGTYTNLWYIDVTFAAATSGSYSSKAAAWHPALYDEATNGRVDDSFVPRCLNDDTVAGATVSGATQADILTISNTNANTFTVFKTGSTAVEPRSDNGTQFRFYLHTRDGSNPNSNGRTVRVVDQRSVVPAFGPGQIISDLIFQRTGAKDMVGVANGAVKPASISRCDFLQAAVHAAVLGGVELRQCRAVAAAHGDARRDGGGAFHQYRSNVSDGQSGGVKMFDLEAEGFAHAIYSHGQSSATPPTHDTLDVDGLIARNCGDIISTTESPSYPVAQYGSRLRRVRGYGIGIAVNNLATGAVSFEDSQIHMTGTLCVVVANAATLKFTRSFVYGPTAIFDPNSLGVVASGNYPTLTLVDSTIIGTFADPGNAARRQQHWTLQNSILSRIASAWTTGTITADATSSIEFDFLTREDLIAAQPNVNASAATGARRQSYVRTILSADLSFLSTSRTATYSGTPNGDGTADLTMNFNDATYGRWIRVVDAYGSGSHYEGRITDKGTAGSSQVIKVTPAPVSAFSSKAVSRSYTNFWPMRDNITATISSDGTQIRVPDNGHFYVGMFFFLSKPFGGGSFGLRQVASIDANNVITLNTAATWKISTDNIVYNSVDGVTTTGRRPLPTVTVSFGFPIMKRNSVSMTRPLYSVAPVEGGAAITSAQNSNTTARFDATATNVVVNVFPDGTTMLAYQGVAHEAGYIETGFSLAPGDVLTIEMDCDVSVDRLTFLTPPSLSKLYLPDPNCTATLRGSGYSGG